MTQAPIRVITYLRTGSCSEGRVIEDRVLKPITTAERKRGVKDELTEWYRTYGCVRHVRRVGDRHRERVRRQPREERIPHDPPKEIQVEVYNEMRAHLHLVALDLANSQVIGFSEIDDLEHELFRAAIEELPNWNPEKSSRRTFLYEVVAANKYDVIRNLNRLKRQGDYHCIPITNTPLEEADIPPQRSPAVSTETIPERGPTSIQKLEFELALKEFSAMLDPDELLSLDYLLQGYEGTEVAEKMGRKYTTWRKGILESLQMKAERCGFYPHNK